MIPVTPMTFPDYARDDAGQILERVVEIPFRLEFLAFFRQDGAPHAAMPWAEPDPMKDATYEPKGTLSAPEPPPYLSYLFGLDLRACAKYGVNFADVSRVELPALDFALNKPLVMRAHVRVRRGS